MMTPKEEESEMTLAVSPPFDEAQTSPQQDEQSAMIVETETEESPTNPECKENEGAGEEGAHIADVEDSSLTHDVETPEDEETTDERTDLVEQVNGDDITETDPESFNRSSVVQKLHPYATDVLIPAERKEASSDPVQDVVDTSKDENLESEGSSSGQEEGGVSAEFPSEPSDEESAELAMTKHKHYNPHTVTSGNAEDTKESVGNGEAAGDDSTPVVQGNASAEDGTVEKSSLEKSEMQEETKPIDETDGIKQDIMDQEAISAEASAEKTVAIEENTMEENDEAIASAEDGVVEEASSDSPETQEEAKPIDGADGIKQDIMDQEPISAEASAEKTVAIEENTTKENDEATCIASAEDGVVEESSSDLPETQEEAKPIEEANGIKQDILDKAINAAAAEKTVETEENMEENDESSATMESEKAEAKRVADGSVDEDQELKQGHDAGEQKQELLRLVTFVEEVEHQVAEEASVSEDVHSANEVTEEETRRMIEEIQMTAEKAQDKTDHASLSSSEEVTQEEMEKMIEEMRLAAEKATPVLKEVTEQEVERMIEEMRMAEKATPVSKEVTEQEEVERMIEEMRMAAEATSNSEDVTEQEMQRMIDEMRMSAEQADEETGFANQAPLNPQEHAIRERYGYLMGLVSTTDLQEIVENEKTRRRQQLQQQRNTKSGKYQEQDDILSLMESQTTITTADKTIHGPYKISYIFMILIAMVGLALAIAAVVYYVQQDSE
jgi:hypothetical protein